jgi:poly(A) polymerase/tRNA nucleotidyltransferase (CCA-adding enzyme)
MKFSFPEQVKKIADELEKNGHQAYLVGGCVRDILLGREPKDWDIATDAHPEMVQKIFPESVYENEFGTVGVKTGSNDENLKIVEVTTFRIEGRYTDKRHPDEIRFAKTIEEDLSRRDFTINALAMNKNGELVDPYDGRKDLKAKIIRAVGNPKERFSEDALRLIRAVRFAAELGFAIEQKTAQAIKDRAGFLEMIAKERIRDEFIKIIMTPRAAEGLIALENYGLLQFIMPELREGIGCGQNKHHIYDVFEHNVRALGYSAGKNYSLVVRLASLLHDVGKPRTKRGEGPDSTFYNHEVVGAKMAVKMLDRLHFPKEIVEAVGHLVRYHLFYYNVGEVTAAGVRRFLNRVGVETVPDLIKVREADRIGSGVPKAMPYKLRHLLFMIEKVKNDPLSPKMLKINGNDVMKILGIAPGPKVGQILSILLEEVLDDPQKNNVDYLKARVQALGKLADKDLEKMAFEARAKKEEFESGLEAELKRKHRVS